MFNLYSLFHFFAASDAAQACNDDKSQTILGLVKWYHYLNYVPDNVYPGKCTFTAFSWNSLTLIGLAVLDDLLRIAGMVALWFIVYGGIKYTLSQGSPDKIQDAQNTIQSAIIGLVIAISGVAIVSFIGKAFTT